MKVKANFFRGIFNTSVFVVFAAFFGVVTSTCGEGRQPTNTQSTRDFSPAGDVGSPGRPGLKPEVLRGTPKSVTLADVLKELDDLDTPPNVDANIFAQLKSALSSELSTLNAQRSPAEAGSTGRFASKPPTGPANRVTDLTLLDNGDGTFTLTWTYKNVGDYDQNGIVAIADITPLAEHFLESSDPTNEWIDGNADGIINISDVTPLAENFFSELSGYVVESAYTLEAPFSQLAEVSLADAIGDGRKRFSYTITVARSAFFQVTPRDTAGSYGLASDPVELRIEGGGWPMFGRDPQHTRRSPYFGAQAPNVKWRFDLAEGTGYFGWNIAVGEDGTVYALITTTGDFERKLVAIDSGGSLKWEFSVGRAYVEHASPAIASDGTIYVVAETTLFALNSDGSTKWKSEIGSAFVRTMVIGPDGTVYLGTGDGFTSTQDSYIKAVSPNGSLKWEYLVGGPVLGATPAIGKNSTIYAATYEFDVGAMNYQGRVLALNPDGTLKWELESEGPFWSSPAVDEDGTVYIGVQIGRYNELLKGFLYAIDENGSFKWKFELGNWVSSSPAIGKDGTIYFGANDGFFYALNPDGTLKWRYEVGGMVISSPAVGGDGTIYFAGDDFFALGPDGTLKWRFLTPFGYGFETNPAIGEDGTVYAVNKGRGIYAFNDDGTPPPVINVVSTQSGSQGEEVTFVADVTGIPPYFYYWNFGDAIVEGETEGTADVVSARVTLGEPGVYPVTVYVEDSVGADEYSFDLTISGNARPIADLTALPPSGYAPLTVTFDAGASTDPDGTIVKYEWDWDGNGTYDYDSGAEAIVQHTYEEALPPIDDDYPPYRAEVRVTDNGGRSEVKSAQVAVFPPAPPTITGVYPLRGRSGSFRTFYVGVYGSNPLNFNWNFGGASQPNVSIERFPSVLLGNPGEYYGSLTVTNGFGSDSVNLSIVILPDGPAVQRLPLLIDADADDQHLSKWVADFDALGLHYEVRDVSEVISDPLLLNDYSLAVLVSTKDSNLSVWGPRGGTWYPEVEQVLINYVKSGGAVIVPMTQWWFRNQTSFGENDVITPEFRNTFGGIGRTIGWYLWNVGRHSLANSPISKGTGGDFSSALFTYSAIHAAVDSDPSTSWFIPLMESLEFDPMKHERVTGFILPRHWWPMVAGCDPFWNGGIAVGLGTEWYFLEGTDPPGGGTGTSKLLHNILNFINPDILIGTT